MTGVEIVSTAIIAVSELIGNLARTLDRAQTERFDPAMARAEIKRMMDDVKIDEAIERRAFERARAERN